MSRDEQDVHPCLRRSAEGAIQKSPSNSDFQRLMWTVFFYDKTYSKADLAAYIGVAVDTVHAYANGDLRLHVDTARKVCEFVLLQNPKDRRFAKYFIPNGWTVVPLDIYDTLEDIANMALDLKAKIRASRDAAKRE